MWATVGVVSVITLFESHLLEQSTENKTLMTRIFDAKCEGGLDVLLFYFPLQLIVVVSMQIFLSLSRVDETLRSLSLLFPFSFYKPSFLQPPYCFYL